MAGDKLLPAEPGSVKVGGTIGKRAGMTIRKNLMAIDIKELFLRPLKEKKSGGDDYTRAGYTGLGKLIDAVVFFAAHNPGKQLSGMKESLVGEILKNQEDDGYIGYFPRGMRVRELWDVHEISYIIQGLTSDYKLFGNRDALKAASLAAGYLVRSLRGKPADYPGKGWPGPDLSALGLEKALLGLSEAANENTFRDFCIKHRKLRAWNRPVVIGRHGGIEGHAYAHMAKCLSQLELYRMTEDAGLLKQANRVVNFWVSGNGMAITGASGQDECWHDTQDGSGNSGETCASVYSLLLLDSMLRLKEKAVYGDLMERIIFNTLFAAQSPGGRRIRYYTPFEGRRSYWPLDTYCCPNNYRRIISRLPGMVYYVSEKGITLNLYTASRAVLKLGGGLPVEIGQVTDYPDSGSVIIMVSPDTPSVFSLKLRIPVWARGVKASINGSPVNRRIKPGGFLGLRRRWKRGDEIALNMPMPWTLVKGRQNQAGRAAVMRGPVVFCMKPGLNPSFSGSDPRMINIDPSSEILGKTQDFKGRVPECRLRAWLPGRELASPPDGVLRLRSFAEPEGEMTYFRLQDPGCARDDELLAGQGEPAFKKRAGC